MVSAISAVLAFMPPPPLTATDRLLGASQGAEHLLLMDAAADGSASPDRSPAMRCYHVMPRLGFPSRPRSSRRSPRHGAALRPSYRAVSRRRSVDAWELMILEKGAFFGDMALPGFFTSFLQFLP